MTKNITKGGKIDDLKELEWLSQNKRTVVVKYGNKDLYIKPAAFLIGWPLKTLLKYEFYYAIKNKSNLP